MDKMLIKSILILCLCVFMKIEAKRRGHNKKHSHTVQCDYYEGYPVTQKQLSYYRAMGVEQNCTIVIKPCDSNEKFSRLDGSCNNLNRACRGTYFEPMCRTLKASFTNEMDSRKAKSGKELELPRAIRTTLHKEGYSNHDNLTSAITAYAAFAFMDIGSIHDIDQLLVYVLTSCDPEYVNDYWSTPNLIPETDPYRKITNISCLNLTRAIYHQNYQCTEDSTPSPIVKATSGFDLSQIYNHHNDINYDVRSYKDGLLATEEENGKAWPPHGEESSCLANEQNESRCYKNHVNGLPFINVLIHVFFDAHNYIARRLKEINPCWDDEMTFQKARELNIAIYMQIFLYEYSSSLMGRENLIEAGVLSDGDGHRDVYDDTEYPCISLEYEYIQRWLHFLQQGRLKHFDEDGHVYKEEMAPELVTRTGYLARDKNLEGMTAAIYRQPSANPDCIDVEMSERGLGKLNTMVDTITSDIHKGRLFGIESYVSYLLDCFGVNVTNFEGLKPFIPSEKIELLKEVYEDVSDIDLYAGVSLEYYVEGGFAPLTFVCISKKYLRHVVTSDRFFYERPGIFTEGQLAEIRKVTFARVLCAAGAGVTEIQPNAFFNIGSGNEIVSCNNIDKIPELDFTQWADSACGYS